MERFDALLFCYQNKIHIFVLKHNSVMIRFTKSKFIDKSSLGTIPMWHIVHREFVTTCPHCAQPIYAFTDAITDAIKWNEMAGHHIPIGGLRKPFPQERRIAGIIVNCYRNDAHLFYKEKIHPYGFVNFYTKEDAIDFLKTVIIPERLTFNPTIFYDEESRKEREKTIERLANEEYFIIPVYPADNIEYCIDAKFDINYHTSIPEYQVIILSDVYITIEVEKYIK